MKRLLVWIVRAYQLVLSPMLGQNCRFYPSCSHYAIEALQTHGAARGSWLAARNLPLRNVLLDARGQALEAFNRRGLPTTLFFDAKGRLISTRTGELSAATLAERLESIN